MEQVLVNFRMDKDLKKSMEQTCQLLGLNMTTAFTIFAKKMSREQRIPFEVSVDPFSAVENTFPQNRLSMEERTEILRKLRGSCKDPTMVEPLEIPLSYDLHKEYDLI